MFLEDNHGNRVGFICDRCGTEVISGSLRIDNFQVDYTCGYGTALDDTRISFQICDTCLHEIVEKEIPKAIIKE